MSSLVKKHRFCYWLVWHSLTAVCIPSHSCSFIVFYCSYPNFWCQIEIVDVNFFNNRGLLYALIFLNFR